MLVNHERGMIFIHPPKTGGGSVRTVLQQSFGFRHVPEIQAEDWHCWQVPAPYAGFKVFGTIRNPYARFLSWYAHLMARHDNPSRGKLAGHLDEWGRCDFATFAKVMLAEGAPVDFRPLSTMLAGAAFVLRQEQLAKDFAQEFGEVSLPTEINKYSHPAWQSCYTPEVVDLVRMNYSDDFERYGYDVHIS